MKIFRILSAVLSVLLISAAFGTGVELVSGSHTAGLFAASVSISASLLFKSMPNFAFALPATDASAIAGYAGSFDKTLIHAFLNGLDFVKDLTVRRNVKAPINLTKMTVSDGARPLDLNIKTAKNPGRTYSGRILNVGCGMKIFEMVPQELKDTWMSEMLVPNAKQVPFAQWVWQREFEHLAAETNDNFYFNEDHSATAAYNAALAYVAGDYVKFNEVIYKANASAAAGQSPATNPALWDDFDNQSIFDGPGKIIADEILAANLTEIATGVVNNTNALEKHLQMWRSATDAHKTKGMIQYVSMSGYEDLIDDTINRHGTGNGVSGMDIDVTPNGVFLKKTNGKCLVKPATWMSGTDRIIQTMAGNMVVGMNQVSDLQKIGKVVENLHGLEAIAKYYIGFQVRDLDVLYVNDQV